MEKKKYFIVSEDHNVELIFEATQEVLEKIIDNIIDIIDNI